MALPGPGGRGTPDRASRRGGFYINPSRRGPVPGPGGLGPQGPESRKPPFSGISGKKGPKWAYPDLLGPGTRKPRKSRDRAPPRGVDVKPPLAGIPESAEKGRKGPKRRKRPKKAIFEDFGDFRQFWRFSGPLGDPRDPSAGVAFTSTPRGGALWPLPRSRGGREPGPRRGGVTPAGGAGGLPLRGA